MAIFNPINLVISLFLVLLADLIYWVFKRLRTGARRRAFIEHHGCLPPKKLPVKLPFGIDLVIGNLQALNEKRYLEAFQDIFLSQNTHTLSISLLGRTFLLTDDPENYKCIHSTNFPIWCIDQGRVKFMRAIMGKGIFTTNGREWKHSRDMLRPCFERSQVADFTIFERHTNNLLKRLRQLAKENTVIDLESWFGKLTLDAGSELLFGRSTLSLGHEAGDWANECEKFVHAFEYCANHESSQSGPRKKWGWIGIWLPDPGFKQQVKVMEDFTDKMIELASKSSTDPSSSGDRYIFVHNLRAQTEDRVRVRAELLNTMLAGRDTTASLMTNIFHELPQHPDMIARLRKEIAEVVGNDIPTFEQLKGMPYLKAVVNESLRLHVTVPFNTREAIQDTTIPRGGGPSESSSIFIPKGTRVLYHTYSLHRRPDIYGYDADKFNPSRWIDKENEMGPLRPGWGYQPFGGGPRLCIGQQFGLMEAMFTVVRILQNFEVVSKAEGPWRESLSIICTNAEGAKVELKAIN